METISECAHCCKQDNRLRLIENFCSKHPEYKTNIRNLKDSKRIFSNFRLNTNTNVLACLNAKVASRFWGHTIAGASSNDEVDVFNLTMLHNIGVFKLSDLDLENVEKVIHSTVKVVTVRHPIERILSAYRDKFIYSVMGKGSLDAYRYIIINYRKQSPNNIEQQSFVSGEPKISLTEFVRLVTDQNAPFNVHWITYMESCHPCAIKYDHVIRTETMQFDTKPILPLLHGGKSAEWEIKIQNSRSTSTHDINHTKQAFPKTLSEFDNVPKQYIRNLIEHFKDDLETFGYTFSADTLEASCAISNINSLKGCC